MNGPGLILFLPFALSLSKGNGGYTTPTFDLETAVACAERMLMVKPKVPLALYQLPMDTFLDCPAFAFKNLPRLRVDCTGD